MERVKKTNELKTVTYKYSCIIYQRSRSTITALEIFNFLRLLECRTFSLIVLSTGVKFQILRCL